MINVYTDIVGCLHSDMVGESYTETECRRDIAEMRHRVFTQGIVFLTKTLPRFGKAIDLALSKGVPLSVPGFKKKSGTELPQYLWGLTSQVFDQYGCELPLGNAHALRSLRQILYAFYKLEVPYAEEDKKRVIDSFLEVENTLSYERCNLNSSEEIVLRDARSIILRCLCNADPRVIRPRHGPGAVATGDKPWQKPYFKVYNTRIGAYYDYSSNFYYNQTHFTDQLDQFLDLPEVDGRPARVVLVPKDSRGPRLISCEPPENQWIQQGQMSLLVETLENHPSTRGHVNFRDQTFNQWYSWLGSKTGDLVTLDMKEASDRVSLKLVEDLFPANWYEALLASRSSDTMLPDGRTVRMKKFAPMGSAVCFPVEALIFFALGVAAIMSTYSVSFSQAKRFFYVYGDDLICSLDYHEAICQYFPKFGLMLNEDKCCTKGFFRESCGFDAYRGTNVTPAKFRCVWALTSNSKATSRLSPASYVSYVAYSNAMYAKGYYHTAQYLQDIVVKHYPKTPFFTEEGGCIAFVRRDNDCRSLNKQARVKSRFNGQTHKLEYLGLAIKGADKQLRKIGWEELLRITSMKPCPAGSDDDLVINAILPQSVISAGLYPIPHRNRLQLRWTPAAL